MARPAVWRPRPGWPLAVIFLGFPVWWLLGLGMLIFLIMSVPMAVHLYKRRSRLLAPRGFGAWILFCCWVLLGAGVLWANAPGAVPGGSMGRLLPFAWRIAWYAAATIVLLYIANLSDEELPADRVGRLLGSMFIVTTAGGLLGTFAPHLQLTSPVEMLLHTNNTFLLDAIHPKTADVATILGYEQARPMAPFAYANTWGAAYAFFLPFFVITWIWRADRWRRVAGIAVLLASLWPVVYSLDRGLWIALGMIMCFAGLKMVARGGRRALRLAVSGLAVGVLVFVVSPLPSMIEARIQNPHSNNRRTLLAEQSVRSSLTGSPVVGFGTTRAVQGNLSSLTGGDRPGCKACGAPPLGTQGHLWLLLFANGLVGTVAFGVFFITRFARHWRERSAYGVAGCCVLLAFGLFLFIYDLVEVPLYTVMIAVALMWRARREADGVEVTA
ncbi:hypothetical protein [Actinomadura sp. DC4]|uniref:hypothetical protein n=1 Tax=Actinomadura sp. DC4 TaxID=3055069 RepID=UPI0025B1C249|nr:hypothetical protein [Actinomadura sp. DC4]MDN3352512.1 hypothetical protein [Actinomadura sp. DC4]